MSRSWDMVRKIEAELEQSELQHLPVERAELRPDTKVVFHSDPRSLAADRFRLLRMRLREIWNTGKLRSLLITSPLPHDGKSTVALNLATALAERGARRVLLIEADLHQPSLVTQLGLETWPGLVPCLEDEDANPFASIRRIEPLQWYLMPAGKAPQNASDLLQTGAFGSMLQKLNRHFDWILIDSPPVGPLTDAPSLARHADATLMVARSQETSRDLVKEAIALIGRERVVGVVLNGVAGLEEQYSKYYKSYYQNSGNV